ncbi:MAG TPA: hypothetical protein VD907_03300 [Verrucomicrobiae bacterium]|nr:hypothetical protein [Verrucomicrobiae bacterium]
MATKAEQARNLLGAIRKINPEVRASKLDPLANNLLEKYIQLVNALGRKIDAESHLIKVTSEQNALPKIIRRIVTGTSAPQPIDRNSLEQAIFEKNNTLEEILDFLEKVAQVLSVKTD